MHHGCRVTWKGLVRWDGGFGLSVWSWFLDLWPEHRLAQIQHLVFHMFVSFLFYALSISCTFTVSIVLFKLGVLCSLQVLGAFLVEGVSTLKSSALVLPGAEACAALEQMRCLKFEGNRPGAKLPISHSAEGP